MFQRLSSLFFGSVEEVTPELKGPKPCVTEADEEGWLLVNLPGECPEQTMKNIERVPTSNVFLGEVVLNSKIQA